MFIQEEISGKANDFRSLCKKHNVKYLYAFGSSVSSRFDKDHSDIDLLIIQDSVLPRPQRYAQVRRLFWGMGLPMDILVYTPQEFARFASVPGSFAHTVSQQGKVLYDRPGN